MKKIDKRFKEVMNRGEMVLVSGVPVGYPNLSETPTLVNLYIDAGIDVVEFSMPARNPYIDTQIIADSNIIALNHQPDINQYFETLHLIREEHPDEPFYMMAYADFIMEFGLEKFVDELVSLEIDGVELPDKDEMVPEFAANLDTLFEEKGVYRIYFARHPFDEKYIQSIKEKINGFLILQAIADENGKRPNVAPENKHLIDIIKSEVDAPVVIGYGIRHAEHVRQALSCGADGVLIGTSMVEHITQGDYKKFSEYIDSLKKATKK